MAFVHAELSLWFSSRFAYLFSVGVIEEEKGALVMIKAYRAVQRVEEGAAVAQVPLVQVQALTCPGANHIS